MTFEDLRQKLNSGEVSSKELVQEKINRINEFMFMKSWIPGQGT